MRLSYLFFQVSLEGAGCLKCKGTAVSLCLCEQLTLPSGLEQYLLCYPGRSGFVSAFSGGDAFSFDGVHKVEPYVIWVFMVVLEHHAPRGEVYKRIQVVGVQSCKVMEASGMRTGFRQMMVCGRSQCFVVRAREAGFCETI